ncbi:MAG: hypothetical protein JSW11_17805 [Candidatus Heimdallarchaeota archaeon]|nr:MAG: hypothetical protein JSW11_17805 [Candidatus Heimdallarchaeota archaeon]
MKYQEIVDPILFRQHIKLNYADVVWNAYIHKEKVEQLLNKELVGSLNSLVQLFLQYVVKEWACPKCLQVILPFMKNCYRELPERGDIVYVSSSSLLSNFPVLSCPHCETQIVVIATSEHSDIFEFRYQFIKGEFFDLIEQRALTDSEISELGLTKKDQQ